MLQSGQDVEKRRFSGTGRPLQEDHLAPCHIEVDALEDFQVVSRQIVGLPEAACPELDGGWHGRSEKRKEETPARVWEELP
jgi:hypothetical protein